MQLHVFLLLLNKGQIPLFAFLVCPSKEPTSIYDRSAAMWATPPGLCQHTENSGSPKTVHRPLISPSFSYGAWITVQALQRDIHLRCAFPRSLQEVSGSYPIILACRNFCSCEYSWGSCFVLFSGSLLSKSSVPFASQHDFLLLHLIVGRLPHPLSFLAALRLW